MRSRVYGRLWLSGLAVWILAACAMAPAATPTPAGTPTPRTLSDDPAALQAEYQALPAGAVAAGRTAFTASGCAACHALEPDKRIVGPSLAGVATRAATRRPGLTAALYLYESITRPNAFIVAGFQPGLMPQNFIEKLPPQTLADLIAFLLSLQ